MHKMSSWGQQSRQRFFSLLSSWPPVSSGHCSLNPIEPGVLREALQWRIMGCLCMVCVFLSLSFSAVWGQANHTEQCRVQGSLVISLKEDPLAALSSSEESQKLWMSKHSAGWRNDKHAVSWLFIYMMVVLQPWSLNAMSVKLQTGQYQLCPSFMRDILFFSLLI